MSTENAEKASLNRLEQMLQLCMPKIEDVIPELARKNFTAEKLVRIFIAAASRKPEMHACTDASKLFALLAAAETGLEPETPRKLAYLIPRKNKWNNDRLELQYTISYMGLILLMHRSGSIDDVDSEVVYEKDVFRYRKGSERFLIHEPDYLIESDEKRGRRVAAWAAVYLIGTDKPHVEVMPWHKIMGIKARAQSKSGPWATDEDEMARKTVLRRASKFVPLTDTQAAAMRYVDAEEAGQSTNLEDWKEDMLRSRNGQKMLPPSQAVEIPLAEILDGKTAPQPERIVAKAEKPEKPKTQAMKEKLEAKPKASEPQPPPPPAPAPPPVAPPEEPDYFEDDDDVIDADEPGDDDQPTLPGMPDEPEEPGITEPMINKLLFAFRDAKVKAAQFVDYVKPYGVTVITELTMRQAEDLHAKLTAQVPKKESAGEKADRLLGEPDA